MKKILSILFTAALFLGMGSPALASSNEDKQKALEVIEKTNREIDKKIEKAVKKADELQAEFLLDIQKIEEGDKVVKLKEEKDKALKELEKASNEEKKEKKLEEKIAKLEAQILEQQTKINDKIAEIELEIEEITLQLTSREKDTKKLDDKINKLKDKLDKRQEKLLEKTERYTKELQKVIDNVYNETFEMSAEAIKKAAEKGIIAECSWTLVRFADQWVWIDPVRVVKM